MGFCAEDCRDSNHTCTAWDGKGSNKLWDEEKNYLGPNHNLAECPEDIATCEYRKEKIDSGYSIHRGK